MPRSHRHHSAGCRCERCWERMLRRMGSRPEPFDEEFKRRLLTTLETDPDFAHDMRLLLGVREGDRFYELWPDNYVADAESEPIPRRRGKMTIRLGDADA